MRHRLSFFRVHAAFLQKAAPIRARKIISGGP
jgi:hypothetical protein